MSSNAVVASHNRPSTTSYVAADVTTQISFHHKWCHADLLLYGSSAHMQSTTWKLRSLWGPCSHCVPHPLGMQMVGEPMSWAVFPSSHGGYSIPRTSLRSCSVGLALVLIPACCCNSLNQELAPRQAPRSPQLHVCQPLRYCCLDCIAKRHTLQPKVPPACCCDRVSNNCIIFSCTGLYQG
jgi:hypothetical protein